jgi:hypothetical protein
MKNKTNQNQINTNGTTDCEYYAFIQGQEDSKKGVYDPPHKAVDGIFASQPNSMENDAYNKGWRSAKDRESD